MPKEYCEAMSRGRLGKKFPNQYNGNHHNWKGNNITYISLHNWVKYHKGKPSKRKCINCGDQAYDWSNVDHLYKRNLDDYEPRCRNCHLNYDLKHNLR